LKVRSIGQALINTRRAVLSLERALLEKVVQMKFSKTTLLLLGLLVSACSGCVDADATRITSIFDDQNYITNCAEAKSTFRQNGLGCDYTLEKLRNFAIFKQDAIFPSTLNDLCCKSCKESTYSEFRSSDEELVGAYSFERQVCTKNRYVLSSERQVGGDAITGDDTMSKCLVLYGTYDCSAAGLPEDFGSKCCNSGKNIFHGCPTFSCNCADGQYAKNYYEGDCQTCKCEIAPAGGCCTAIKSWMAHVCVDNKSKDACMAVESRCMIPPCNKMCNWGCSGGVESRLHALKRKQLKIELRLSQLHQLKRIESKIGHRLKRRESKIGHRLKRRESKIGHRLKRRESRLAHALKRTKSKIELRLSQLHRLKRIESKIGHRLKRRESKIGHNMLG